MELLELLKVSDTFQLSGIGLTLAPAFRVPSGWKNIQANVLVAKPNGDSVSTTAQFNLTHFRAPDPDARWRIFVTLPELSKELVPVGSSLLVPPEVVAALAPLVDLRPAGDAHD